MDWVDDVVRVQVPATSANLGPTTHSLQKPPRAMGVSPLHVDAASTHDRDWEQHQDQTGDEP